MWTGGRARLGTGYEWLDGSPFVYDNWASGEPNDVFGETWLLERLGKEVTGDERYAESGDVLGQVTAEGGKLF